MAVKIISLNEVATQKVLRRRMVCSRSPNGTARHSTHITAASECERQSNALHQIPVVLTPTSLSCDGNQKHRNDLNLMPSRREDADPPDYKDIDTTVTEEEYARAASNDELK